MRNKQINVSVIVPCYNAKYFLAHSLPAIRKSDYPYYELIVVDDNSTDGSERFAKKYADKVIKMRSNGAPGKARNTGAQASQGSILFFVDADVQIASDSISGVVKTMIENPEIGAVFGSYDEKPYYKNFCSQYKNLFHHFVHQNASPDASTFWAGCGAIKKELFLEAGGFPEIYSTPSIEDVELGYKLKEKGIKVRLLKELQVTHFKKWSFFNLIKTDIVRRALPWAKLAFDKGLPKDLNFKLSDRISGLISCLFFLCLILIWLWFPVMFVSVVLAGILFYANRKLYKFFLEKRVKGGINCVKF